jgi:hypothetical protein
MYEVGIEHMIGKKFSEVVVDKDNRCILFICKEGLYKMHHEQDCCEDVHIESIVGDISDLFNSPIENAEEVIAEGKAPEDEFDSTTWTFYKFKTYRGYVDIRWVGTSNGYYSERVDIEFMPFKEYEDDRK